MDIKNAFVHISSVLEGKIYGIYLDKSKEKYIFGENKINHKENN